MRLAGEKEYELTNGDSVRDVTDDLIHILGHAWSAAGSEVPAKFKIMFDLEA